MERTPVWIKRKGHSARTLMQKHVYIRTASCSCRAALKIAVSGSFICQHHLTAPAGNTDARVGREHYRIFARNQHHWML